MYSSGEIGTIAIQCPDNAEVYHVMENVLLEIVDDQGNPALQGRVLLTDLTSPHLHRYDIGDDAELGTCFCGRGLQTIKRILGRRRNRVKLPDGTSHWPLVGSMKFIEIAPIERYQIVQTAIDTLEVRFQMSAALTEWQRSKLTELIHAYIGYPFQIRFITHYVFPSGKFEEFLCLV